VIVVHRLDRLARDLVLQETVLADVRRLGAEVRSTSAVEQGYLETIRDPQVHGPAPRPQPLPALLQHRSHPQWATHQGTTPEAVIGKVKMWAR
jgi:hypothetical protein